MSTFADPWALTIAIAIVIIVALVIHSSLLSQRNLEEDADRMREIQAERPPASPSTFTDLRGAPLDPALVDRVRHLVAEISESSFQPEDVAVDPNLLRPEDRLDIPLGYHLDSLAHAELHMRLEREFRIHLDSSALMGACTLADVIRHTANAIAAHKQATPDL